jgi:hypothetical protein
MVRHFASASVGRGGTFSATTNVTPTVIVRPAEYGTLTASPVSQSATALIESAFHPVGRESKPEASAQHGKMYVSPL